MKLHNISNLNPQKKTAIFVTETVFSIKENSNTLFYQIKATGNFDKEGGFLSWKKISSNWNMIFKLTKNYGLKNTYSLVHKIWHNLAILQFLVKCLWLLFGHILELFKIMWQSWNIYHQIWEPEIIQNQVEIRNI